MEWMKGTEEPQCELYILLPKFSAKAVKPQSITILN